MIAWTRDLYAEPELIRLVGVDHLFHGKLTLFRMTLLGTLEGWDDQEDR